MGIAVQGGVVPFYDLNGESPKFDLDRESASITRVGEISWADGDALIAECFPSGFALPGTYPGKNYLYVQSLSIEPLSPIGEGGMLCADVAIYGRGKATIKYGKLPFEPSNFITRRWGFSGEFMTIPASSMKWLSDSLAVQNEEISAAKIIPMIEHSITRHRATTVPWSAIKANIGHINDAPLNNAIFTGVGSGQLLYLGANIDFTFSTDGTQIWNIEHRFQERKVRWNGLDYGWNEFWRPDAKKWDQLVDDNGDPVYPTSNTFLDLFV